jgi:hypothetical protein
VLEETKAELAAECLHKVAQENPVDPIRLASSVMNKSREKWDHLLPDDLLCASYSSSFLDVAETQKVLSTINWTL